MKFKVKVTLSEIREWDTDWFPDVETPEQVIKKVLADEKEGDLDLLEFFGESKDGYESKVEKI